MVRQDHFAPGLDGARRSGCGTTGRPGAGRAAVPVLDPRRRSRPGPDRAGRPGHGPHRGRRGLRGRLGGVAAAARASVPGPDGRLLRGLAWTHRHAAELGVDPARIAVGGASSGGGSAAGLALLARDRGELPVGFQLLIYPMLDDRNVTPASRALTDPRVWNRASNLIGWGAYLGDAAGTDLVSAVRRARPGDRPGRPAARLPGRGRPRPVHRRGHRVRPAAAAGRRPDRAARLPGRHPRLRLVRAASALARRFAADRDEALRRAFAT